MATRIRASCDACGDVDLTVDDVHVRVCNDDDRGAYVFTCPGCATAVVKDAEARIVDLLVASGVRITRWTVPAELFEPRAGGRAFTHDDVIDFHLLLAQDGWFESLRGMVDDAAGGAV